MNESVPPLKQSNVRAASLGAAAALMVITTLASRVTGLVRMMVIGHLFGKTPEVNAFFQAFVIPDFFFFLIAGGALRTGFVPIFSEYITTGQEKRAWITFSNTFWTLLLFACLLVGGGMLYAPWLTAIIARGWVNQPELFNPCVHMMRILFPAQIAFMIGGLMQGALNAKKHFLWPGLGGIIYNMVIIIGAFVGRHVGGVTTIAYFVLGGALLGNVICQIPPLIALGAKLEAKLNITDEGMIRILKMSLPVIFGLAIGEIDWIIVKALCTHFDSGPMVLEFANRLWKLPSGIFAAGVAIAIFPSLAEHYTRKDEKLFVRDFSFGMRNSMFMMVPATLVLGAMRTQVIRLLFQHGEFTAETTSQVADLMFWLIPSMIAMGICYIAARALYARHSMWPCVWAGVASIVMTRLSAYWLMPPFGLNGLGMANTIGDVGNAVLLLWILKALVGQLDGKNIIMAQVKCLPANLFIVAVGILIPPIVERHVGTHGLVAHTIGLMVPLTIAMVGFFVLAGLFRVDELSSAWALMRRKGRKVATYEVGHVSQIQMTAIYGVDQKEVAELDEIEEQYPETNE